MRAYLIFWPITSYHNFSPHSAYPDSISVNFVYTQQKQNTAWRLRSSFSCKSLQVYWYFVRCVPNSQRRRSASYDRQMSSHSPVHRERVQEPYYRHVDVILPVHYRLQVVHDLYNGVVALYLPVWDEHVENSVSRKNGWIVEAPAHRMEDAS